MEIFFIGSGSAKTTLNRHHSSVVISTEGHKLLVDAGDGVSRALVNARMDYNSIDSIVISHFHPDHFSGLPHLIIEMKMIGRTKPLTVYIHESLKETAEQIIKPFYIFYEFLDFKLMFQPFSFDDKITVANGLAFTAKKNSHLDKYKIYDKEGSVSFASASFLFECGDKKIYFSGDLGEAGDLKLFAGVETDYFISEISHVDKNEFISILQNTLTKKIILTHLPEEEMEELNKWIAALPAELKKKTEPAYDGLILK